MLEAMARGLPCVGSSIGGIPELLHEEDLVPLDDPAALAKVITGVFLDPGRLVRMSARNLRKATAYSAANLSHERQKFLRALRELTNNAYSVSLQDGFQTFSSSVQSS
jgi:glycosyltransferase involved in cell wall biosynthesis